MVLRPGHEQTVPNLRARRHVIRACSLINRDRSVRAELVRRRLGEILRLEAEIAKVDRDERPDPGDLREGGIRLPDLVGDAPLRCARGVDRSDS